MPFRYLTTESPFCFPSMVSDVVSWPDKEGEPEPEPEPEPVNAGVEEEETGDLERSLGFAILCFSHLCFGSYIYIYIVL